jgi:hypothetical protein
LLGPCITTTGFIIDLLLYRVICVSCARQYSSAVFEVKTWRYKLKSKCPLLAELRSLGSAAARLLWRKQIVLLVFRFLILPYPFKQGLAIRWVIGCCIVDL